MPEWKDVNVFVWGATWVILLSLGPVLWTIRSWLTDPLDNTISWRQLANLAFWCAGPALVAYCRKNKALLKIPKDDE